eukprot:m.482032 g.482032  ORF g.482032 m.482032 type:complete len:132 (-) comp22407_c0_seq1:105-500(-)
MAAAVRAAVRMTAGSGRRQLKSPKAVIGVTKEAADKLKELLAQAPDGTTAMRLGVKTRGCSGNAFTMDFVKEKGKFDEEVNAHGVTVLVESSSIMKLLGTTMDYVEDELRSEFVFENPNIKGTCGCGESWF